MRKTKRGDTVRFFERDQAHAFLKDKHLYTVLEVLIKDGVTFLVVLGEGGHRIKLPSLNFSDPIKGVH